MHSKHQLAYITPKLLTWAIDRSGIDRAEFIRKIRVKRNVLEAWELGLAHPPFNKAREMAAVLRVEFGYLYLDEIPVDTVPLPDLRRLPHAAPLEPSPEFLAVLYQAMRQHDWYRAYLLEEGAEVLPFASKFKQSRGVDVIATDIRNSLGMDNALRRGASAYARYLTKLSQQAEAIGIVVMRRAVVGNTHRKLNPDEFQGFAISDPIAPLVFINGQDYEAAKIFTLMHELAHIWIGQSGISKIDESLQKPAPHVEEICNKVATETLVPKDEFEDQWASSKSYAQVERLARHFLVSSLVIIRRAKELNKIDYKTFGAFLAEARSRIKPKPAPGSKAKSGGNYYATLDSRNSPIFVNAILQDVKREGTPYRDAAGLLSMGVRTLVKMTEGLSSS